LVEQPENTKWSAKLPFTRRDFQLPGVSDRAIVTFHVQAPPFGGAGWADKGGINLRMQRGKRQPPNSSADGKNATRF
jgi:hypothetical protein